MRLEYVLVVALVNGEAASGAMGMDVASSQRPVALISPVSPRHSIRANHLLVVAIVVLMVLAAVAILCCCYLWERQQRLRMQAARTPPHAPHVGDDTHSSGPQLGSSPPVVVLLGDNVTNHSVAWGVPQRISTSAVSEAVATKPTSTNANQSLRKPTVS